MADPFAILGQYHVDVPGVLGAYDQYKAQDLQSKLMGRKVQQEDAALAGQAAARAAIARGSKPEEVMGSDPDLGMKYAEYVKKNGDAAHEAAQRQAGAIVQIGTSLASLPKGQARQALWQQSVPVLKSVGLPDEQLANFDPNDDAAISAQVQANKALLKVGEDYTLTPGAKRFDGSNRVVAEVPFAPKYEQVDPAKNFVRIDPNGSQGGFNGFYNGFLAGTEGGYAARDGKSGAPVNFGVNQAANPDVNVANLTQEQAAQLLHDRYWVPSGADQIQNPALQAIHADTAINMGVGAAQQMLQASGGDPQKYLALREQRYRRLGGPDLPAWLDRNQKLAQYVGGQSGGGDPNSGGVRVLSRAQPKEKPTAERMSAEEVKADGLDPDLVWYRNKDGLPVNAGGAGAVKVKQAAERQRQALSDRQANAQGIISTIDDVLPKIGTTTAGMLGGNLAGWKGTDAYDVSRQVDTIKANLGFQELSAMRASSPTGGALGQVSERELHFLQSTVANLDSGQSPGQLKENLSKVREHYQNWLDTTNGIMPVKSIAEARKLPIGTRFRVGGDGPTDRRLPMAGEVYKGYRFKGGDLKNQANWTKAE